MLACMLHCCNLSARMKPNTSRQEPGVSATDIAKELGRSHTGVNKAIGRMKLRPVMTLGRIHLYDKREIPKIAEAMRQPNARPAA